MERSSFFNAVLDTNGTPDRVYLAEDYARYFSSFIGNGVFPNPSSNLQVVAVDNNMNIRIKAGRAWVNGYFYENTDDLNLTLDVADGVLNRVDRVVLRLDFINREIKVKVKKGAFASTAIAPSLQRDSDVYEMALADIAVLKGVIKITQSNITDKRLDNNLCGIVHGTVEQVDITTLFNQYTEGFKLKEQSFEQQFQAWFDTIKGQLSGDVAGNLLNFINDNSNKLSTLAGTSGVQEKLNKTTFDSFKTSTESSLGEITTKGFLGDNASGTKLSTNIDTINKSGYYVTQNSITIDGITDWFLINHIENPQTPKYSFQLASALVNAEKQYMRSQVNGVWSAWKKILNKTDYDTLFQYANDGKTKWATVVGSPLLATDTFQQLNDKTQVIKNTLATNLTNQGQSSTGSESLSSLVNKVQSINNGVSVGTAFSLYFDQTTYKTSLKYTPTMVFQKTLLVGGTFRVSFSLNGAYSTHQARGQVYINGVPRGILRSGTSGNTTAVRFTEDFLVNKNDKIQIYGWDDGGSGSQETWIYSPEIRCDNLII